MNRVALANAIRERARRLSDLRSDYPCDNELVDDAGLLRVLALMVEGKDVWRAFGAPGDWGYNHPIGRALAAPEDAEGGAR